MTTTHRHYRVTQFALTAKSIPEEMRRPLGEWPTLCALKEEDLINVLGFKTEKEKGDVWCPICVSREALTGIKLTFDVTRLRPEDVAPILNTMKMENHICPTCGSIGLPAQLRATMESNDGFCIICRPIREAFIAGFKRALSVPWDQLAHDAKPSTVAEGNFRNWMSEKRK